MSLQSRGTRPKNRPDAQHRGASPDHQVHVPSSAERRRIRKERARRRVLAVLTASLVVTTALTAGAFIFPDATAEVLKVADLVKPGAGWTAMFPETNAPAAVKAVASDKAAPSAQPWRTAQAEKPAEPGPSKPAAAYPTETASVSPAQPRLREFDWLPDRPIEAADADANASKLRATAVSSDATITASIKPASAGEASAPKPDAVTHAAGEARTAKVRTVTTTSEAGVATAADAARAFSPGIAATFPETTFVTLPDAPLSTKDAATPDMSGIAAAAESASAPEAPVQANDSPAPTPSVVAAVAEAAIAPASDTAAPARTSKSDAPAVAVETPIVMASVTPPATNPAVTDIVPLLDAPKATAPAAPAGAKGPSAREVAEMIKRARARLDIGDIAGARLLLERAASGNDANALMALAETYDPAMLSRLGVRGPKGDPAKARELYEKAAQSGAPEASQRVLALR